MRAPLAVGVGLLLLSCKASSDGASVSPEPDPPTTQVEGTGEPDGDTEADATASVDTDADADSGADSPTPRPAPKRQCALPVGKSEHELKVGDATRRYTTWVGESVTQPPAVVFAWHGFGGDGAWAASILDPGRLWKDAIVVGAQGLGRTFDQFGDTPRPGWQVTKGEHDDRDLEFFDALYEELRLAGCLDDTRVYTTGFSNGGFFSHVLACHRGDLITAAAPGGGGGPFQAGCKRQVPMYIQHGRRDHTVPYAMAEASWGFWGRHNGCTPDAPVPADGCALAPGCPDEAPVQLCSFDIDHALPEGEADRIAEFLRAHRLPAPK